jgi:hypothetical protein
LRERDHSFLPRKEQRIKTQNLGSDMELMHGSSSVMELFVVLVVSSSKLREKMLGLLENEQYEHRW